MTVQERLEVMLEAGLVTREQVEKAAQLEAADKATAPPSSPG